MQDPVCFAAKALYIPLVPSHVCAAVVSVLPDHWRGAGVKEDQDEALSSTDGFDKAVQTELTVCRKRECLSLIEPDLSS